LYLDLLLITLSEDALLALRSMNSLGFEYQSEFARKYVAQGRAEMVLTLLTLRFGPLHEDIQARVRAADSAQLKSVAEELLTAPTLSDAMRPLS
jgi:hypothetical protein